MKTSILIVLLFLAFPLTLLAEPPYWDTTGALNSIDSTDPTTYVSSVYEGRGERFGLYGATFEEPAVIEAYLFRADYSDGPSMEFQIHPEFGSIEAASVAVELFAPVIGQLPYSLRNGLKMVWVTHDRGNIFRASVGKIYMHYVSGLDLKENGGIEELLAHEASHASLDDLYGHSDEWIKAEIADNMNISVNAQEHTEEEPTQAFLAWMALRYKPERITAWDRQTIAKTIPHRLAFYDSLHLNMEPLAEFKFLMNAGLNDAWFNPATPGQGFFITVFPNIKKVFLAWFTYDIERPPASVTAILGEPGHRWLTAFGDYVDETAMLEIEMSQGGVFDSVTPPVQTKGTDGTIKLEFAGCTEGMVSYDIPSLNLQGKIPIRRIADDNVFLCEKLNNPLYHSLLE